jgi:hypothetical protein
MGLFVFDKVHFFKSYLSFSKMIPYKVIQTQVEQAIGAEVLASMIDYLQGKNLTLWSEQQPHNFLKKMVTLTLYNHINDIGYGRIMKTVLPNFKLNHKFFQHNAAQIRKILAEWGNSTVVLGSVDDLKAAMTNVRMTKQLSKVCLWADSSDFPLEK